jgi:hypothetical protein
MAYPRRRFSSAQRAQVAHTGMPLLHKSYLTPSELGAAQRLFTLTHPFTIRAMSPTVGKLGSAAWATMPTGQPDKATSRTSDQHEI